MREIACIALCFLLAVPCAFAESQPRRLTEGDAAYAWLYEKSMELAGVFNEALHSEGYIALFTVDDFAETVDLLQTQDFTHPEDVTVVRADRALQDAGLGPVAEAVPEADLSMDLEDRIWRMAYHMTGNYLTAREGVETLALSTVLTFTDAYVRPEALNGPCFAVMRYGGLYAFLVTFCPTENATVTAHAQFIPSRAADELALPNE